MLGTQEIGLKFKPSTESFKAYADTDFSGNWIESKDKKDPVTAKSRSGWVINYSGFSILWESKLQTQVALSTMEAEYISLSSCLRYVILLM